MSALLDIDLEQIAQVVERRASVAEKVLLLDRGRLGVTLRNDQATELRAELPGHLPPGRLTVGIAEADRPVGNRIGEEDAPTVIGHLHIAVARPTLSIDAS